jgi:hypothetical protein
MSRPRAPRLTAGAALATGLLALLSGCSHTATPAADRSLHVALNEYRLNPSSVQAHSGLLTIYVRNYGELTHNLVISQNGVTTGATKAIWPGQSAVLSLDLAAGKYLMSSTMQSDPALGLYGTLTVKP